MGALVRQNSAPGGILKDKRLLCQHNDRLEETGGITKHPIPILNRCGRKNILECSLASVGARKQVLGAGVGWSLAGVGWSL